MEETKEPKKLESDEEVVACIQGHWVGLLRSFYILVLGISSSLLLEYISFLLRDYSRIAGIISLIFSFSFLLITIHSSFLFLYQWEISSIVLTTMQVIVIRFFPFLEDDFEFINLDEIHGIEKKKHGFIKNILNYGEVVLAISGRAPSELHQIRKPTGFVNFLEAIKLKKPLEKIDISGIGASCSKKYSVILKM